MSAAKLLSRLEGVRQTGPGRWITRCPAHDDRHPSLAIRELDDGTVLVHCHAACETRSVLNSVGLDFEDLYPSTRRSDHRRRGERRPFWPEDVLCCLANEALVVGIAAEDALQGRLLSPQERARLMTAVVRMRAAAEAMGYA